MQIHFSISYPTLVMFPPSWYRVHLSQGKSSGSKGEVRILSAFAVAQGRGQKDCLHLLLHNHLHLKIVTIIWERGTFRVACLEPIHRLCAKQSVCFISLKFHNRPVRVLPLIVIFFNWKRKKENKSAVKLNSLGKAILFPSWEARFQPCLSSHRKQICLVQ